MAFFTVDSANANTKLAKLDNLKNALTITGAGSDALLNFYIDCASDSIRDICRRHFRRETITEKIATFGRTILLVQRTPIVSITEILFYDSVVTATDYEVADADAGMIFNENGWTSSEQSLTHLKSRVMPDQEARNYTVTYIGGYLMPDEGSRNLPYSIEWACLELAKFFYLERGLNPSISSERLGDYSASYGGMMTASLESGGDLPLVRARLKDWIRVE